MDVDLLEVILKKCTRESSISRVIDVKASSVGTEGDNYASNISRLVCKVVLGNGRISNKSFIFKVTDKKKEDNDDYMERFQIFKTEAKMYKNVLREMGYLMDEFGDKEEKFWCDLYHYEPESCSLLMEDLNASGYTMVPRQDGHDLEHGILTVRALARFHGMAKILESRGIVDKDEYKGSGFFYERLLMKSFLYEGMMATRQAIVEYWGEDWKIHADKMLIPFEIFDKRLRLIKENLDDEFNVLNRGDNWSNNMMFRYDWQGQPTSFKMIDFQHPHYDNLCIDLTCYIYLSIPPPVRHNNLNCLLENYHQSLLATLVKYGYNGRIPTLEELKKEMEKLLLFGQLLLLSIYPHLTNPHEPSWDCDKIISTEGKEGYNITRLKSDEMIEKLGPDVKEFIQTFYTSEL